MSHEPLRNEDLVERASAAIRQEAEGLDPRRIDAALARVQERLGVAPEVPGRVLGCADLQRLLPAFLAGTLSPERELLVADHTRSCVSCRRALKALEQGDQTPAPAVASNVVRGRFGATRWALAAAAAAVLALGTAMFTVPSLWPQGGAQLEVVAGNVIGLGSGAQAHAYAAGGRIPYRQDVVTPRGQSAMVRLADGSVVELRERTRMSVEKRRGGTTMHLEGGNVIVQAAHQEPGKHLWVNTGDCEVAVVGTVFAVDHGARGSRVSVFEGTVKVDQSGRQQRVVRPGGQATTSERVQPMSMEEEVEWSAQREQHLALLAGAALLGQELDKLPHPERRFESPFVDHLPAGTVFYAAVPNLSGNLSEGLAKVRERLAGDPQLATFLGSDQELAKVGILVGKLASLGGMLGPEVAAAAWTNPDAAAEEKVIGPVVYATVADPAAFRARLAAELPTLFASVTDGSQGEHPEHPVRLVDDPANPPAGEGLLVWVGDGTVVVAVDGPALSGAAAALADASSPFAATAFHQGLADRYSNGVDSMLAVDVQALLARTTDAEERAKLERFGITGAQSLVVEQWVESDKTRRQAVLSFSGARQGIASWLAAPAHMGALSFMSADASAVAAFVVKEPRLLVADVLAALTAEERDEFDRDRAQFVAEHGWDPIEDLANPLGGEIAFGLDGPIAPDPSWKLVVEVYDPTRLQVGIERLVADIDNQLREHGEGSLTLTSEGDGWLIRAVKLPGDDGTGGRTVEVHYQYTDGYLVATANAALLDRALRTRASGEGLLQSAKLRNLLPGDSQVSLSALWYQDFSALIGPLAGAVQNAGQLSPELQKLAQMVGQGSGPSVIYAYGEDDAIRISSNSPKSPLGLADLLLTKGRGLDLMSQVAQEGAQIN